MENAKKRKDVIRMTEQDMLNEWTKRYITNVYGNLGCVTFEGYKELAVSDGFRMGYMECKWNLSTKEIKGKIWLDDDHSKCPEFFRNATLWHEFCHYWDCVEFLHVDHCGNFQLKKLNKPLYAFGDVVLKLIGWVWFD